MKDYRHVEVTDRFGNQFNIDVSYSERSWCWHVRAYDGRRGGEITTLDPAIREGRSPFEAIARATSSLLDPADTKSDYSSGTRNVQLRVADYQFSITATYDESFWGWVASVALLGDSEPTWDLWAKGEEQNRAFTTPYDCIGNAVAFTAAAAESLAYNPYPEETATAGLARRLFFRSDLYTLGLPEQNQEQ
ncbi:MAG: hypothetical protein M3R02_21490 [Chloroflexota bacterium]|nr:hypothetical protein [Chloroflexota bacterium]